MATARPCHRSVHAAAASPAETTSIKRIEAEGKLELSINGRAFTLTAKADREVAAQRGIDQVNDFSASCCHYVSLLHPRHDRVNDAGQGIEGRRSQGHQGRGKEERR